MSTSRPVLTPEALARYEEQARAAVAAEMPQLEQLRALMPELLPRLLENLLEVCIAGCWLWDQLLAAGATETGARDITFAHGQACVGGREPWAVAESMLAASRAGRPPTPGAELADRLLMGDVSDLPPGGLRLVIRRGGAPS